MNNMSAAEQVSKKPVLVVLVLVLSLGLGVGLLLVLRSDGLSIRSRAGTEPTLVPTLAVGSKDESASSGNSADLNKDGKVDNIDANLWQRYLQENDLRGDLNKDGKISSVDFRILREQARQSR